MSDSTLPRYGSRRDPRTQGEATIAAVSLLLFVLTPLAVAQTPLAPVAGPTAITDEGLPSVVSRAEYAKRKAASVQATNNQATNEAMLPIVVGDRTATKTGVPSPGVDESTSFAVSAQTPATPKRPSFKKDPTVSAPWSNSTVQQVSKRPMSPAEARQLAKRNGLRKDMTVSQPNARSLVVADQSTVHSPQRQYANMRTARLPFEAESNPFETASSLGSQSPNVQASAEARLPGQPNSDLPAEVHATMPTESRSFPVEVESSTSIEGDPTVPEETEASDLWLSADGEPFVSQMQSGLIHDALPENCNCGSAVAEFWRPEGIELPWPPDEYICDGGDADVRVAVNRQSQVSGLNLEDTVAHYDTEDGRTLVTPSNCVCIYSPRFAAVRKILGAREDDRLLRPGSLDQPLPPVIEELSQPPLLVEQPLPPRRLLDIDGPLALRDRTRGVELDQSIRVAELVREFEAYEDFQVMRIGIDKSADKARIIEHITAAIEWSRAEAPEVIIDREEANVDLAIERTGVIYQLDKGPPCLRIIKLANRCAALPGEIVEFTLRYDNIGEQTVENVTIIDNLTTRLEYVPGSSQSDRKAEFFGDENQGESLVLRWEIKEPLRPGDGGLIRFQCKVR